MSSYSTIDNDRPDDDRCLSPSEDIQCEDNSTHHDDDDLMQAVRRIQRQAALTAAVNPWCYTPPNHLPPSILFGLQGEILMVFHVLLTYPRGGNFNASHP